MPECAVCSSPASNKCARCKCVFYCSPAHQKEDWPAHKVQCPRLAQEALAAVFHPCDEELLLRITTCLAQNGYHKEVGVMVQLNKAFWTDEQIWDAYKDFVPAGLGGRTRLIYAVGRRNVKRIKWFLARGANITAKTPICSGLTALIFASSESLEITRVLLDKGGLVDGPGVDGLTALMAASGRGKLDIVRELCTRGANVNGAMATDGGTALHAASDAGHLGVVLELTGRGANVNAAQLNGYTSLILASQRGHLEIVRSLIARGANVNDLASDSTALLVAAQNGHLAVVRELLGKNAIVNVACSAECNTPLMMACQNSHLSIVRELLNKGASVTAAKSDGSTAMIIASQEGHLEVVRELVGRGASVNAHRTDGASALMLASQFGHLETVRLLLERGADKSTDHNGDGRTAFRVASGPNKAALQALLKP